MFERYLGKTLIHTFIFSIITTIVFKIVGIPNLLETSLYVNLSAGVSYFIGCTIGDRDRQEEDAKHNS